MHPLILKVDEAFDLNEYLKKNHQHEGSPRLISIITIAPENNKSISIDQIRDLKKLLLFEGHFPRFVVFERFELSTTEAQNALLKLIEEEGSYHQFILLTHNSRPILETIQSRCVFKNISHEKKPDSSTDLGNDIEEFLTCLEDGKLKDMLENQIFTVSTAEEAVNFLHKILFTLEKQIKIGNPKAVILAKKTHEVLKLITVYNTHPQLSLDLWLLRCVK